MANFKGAEYRKHMRITKRVALNIIAVNDKETLPKLDAEVGLNIAEGGILIECSKNLSKGARLKLKIMTTFGPTSKIITVPAKVAWKSRSRHDTYYFGCKFTRLNPKDRAVLKKFAYYPWL